MSAPAVALAPDLEAGLRRLKLATVRAIAPEVLLTAKTQRWPPDELLRTLVEAEIGARDAANARARLRAAAFPGTKTLDEFKVNASSVPQATFDYLASLEWIRAVENVCLVGPAGTGKSHLLVALGLAAVAEGRRVRYFTAADLVDTLYRASPTTRSARSSNRSCGPSSSSSTSWASRRSTRPAPNSCSASSPRRTSDAALGSPATGRSSSGGASSPSTRPPYRSSTACFITPRSSSPTARASGCVRHWPAAEVAYRCPETVSGVGTFRGH